MAKIIKYISLAFSFGVLSACTSLQYSVDENITEFGLANHSNIAAHAITPDPDLKENTYIPADRDRVRAAREAYRKGQVKEPKNISSEID